MIHNQRLCVDREFCYNTNDSGWMKDSLVLLEVVVTRHNNNKACNSLEFELTTEIMGAYHDEDSVTGPSRNELCLRPANFTFRKSLI